jgi:hypothetical protein
MSKQKTRITLTAKDVNQKDYLSFIKNLNRTIDMVDDDITVQWACEQVLLKKTRIQNFKGKSKRVFYNAVVDSVRDQSGTNFFIYYN